MGRWTAKDPIRFLGGETNFFNYVVANPVSLTDPSGELPPLLIAGGAILVAGVKGIAVPLLLQALLGDDCDLAEAKRASGQAALIVGATATGVGLAGGAQMAAPVLSTAFVANAPTVASAVASAQNNLPRAGAATPRVEQGVKTSGGLLRSLTGAVSALFASPESPCGCP